MSSAIEAIRNIPQNVTEQKLEDIARDRAHVEHLKQQYRNSDPNSAEAKAALEDISAAYAKHIKTNPNDYYKIRRAQEALKEGITFFVRLAVAERDPEAAIKMLKGHYDDRAVPEIIMEIARNHAGTENGARIALNAVNALETLYHKSKAAGLPFIQQPPPGDPPPLKEQPATGKMPSFNQNVEWALTKLCSRSITEAARVRLYPVGEGIGQNFNGTAGKNFLRETAIQVVPRILEVLENTDNGREKLLHLLRNRTEQIPGLPHGALINEALDRIEEKHDFPQEIDTANQNIAVESDDLDGFGDQSFALEYNAG